LPIDACVAGQGKQIVGKLLTAALIVKDEEKHLAACLRSIAGIVDEIVVVDTGSSDHSRQIAASNGARVFEYYWHDDFAAARNYAIDHAESEWILYIDADERARAYERPSLEGELANPALCACTVRFHPRTGFTAYREHRFFRRDPRIRFQGAIHETIRPDLNRLVAAGLGGIGSSELTIDHLGYDGDQTHKLERNLRLLQKQLQVDPDRIFLWWHLGTVYRDLDRRLEAEAAWRQGVEIARRNSVSGAEDSLCFIELAKLHLSNSQEALKLLREASGFQPDNLLLHWMEARLLAEVGRYDEAISIFQYLASIDANSLVSDVAYDRRILGAWAFAEMAYCAFRRGLYQESKNWYQRAEALEPDCLEFRVKRQLAGKLATTTGSGC